ncbi:MAG TPA: FISUMP domain-containing protein [Ignavibacteriaceae bacterium]|mgnify:CR=1 FL=1|nr:FISUMP domain-containing protein [Ignavibacteriaceae bacterium]
MKILTHTKRVITMVVIMCGLLFAQNTAPVVSNVDFNMRNDGSNIVDITYDVNDVDGQTMTVTIAASSDGGATWNLPITQVTGAVGSGITNGTGKAIVWNAGAEIPNFYSATVQIRITADDGVFPCGSQITYAGKTYTTVKIGNQCWLRENLDVGTMIQGIQQQTNNNVIEKYCYQNDPNNCDLYGGLYDWKEAMQYTTTAIAQGICPPNWRIPTREDLHRLVSSVGNDGNSLKEVGQGIGGGTGTNTSGFSALMSGYRGQFGGFSEVGSSFHFWSTTPSPFGDAYKMNLSYNTSSIYIDYNYGENYGMSVRCIYSPPVSCPDTITYLGKTYTTVLIQSQCWLKENLNVGTKIDGNQNQTNNSIVEKYCYNDQESNCDSYGGLYQWNEAMQYASIEPGINEVVQGICPEGWHIPNKTELETLESGLGNDGNALKALGQGTGSGAGTNTSGFSALLVGTRHYIYGFSGLLTKTQFWSSYSLQGDNAIEMKLDAWLGSIDLGTDNMAHGYSIRCLKNSAYWK